ncbi:hypothetical protein EX30DRAFT_308504 [Ascodesmis nigricans]|uniref:Rhodopsin domain-containing protein n=1 Tax=Ascodesmis nigricans TaxID=341454 RepID=A0A4S2MTJ8_9PEZI|nr:hypothetical protein EX30DRAFT_308504 [Ascodesmis nigricans]
MQEVPPVTPDFLMENQDKPAIVGIVVTAIVATLVVLGRLYARLIVVKKMGADDWLAAVSLALFLVSFGLMIALILYGSGRHMAYVRLLPNDIQLLTQELDFYAHIIYAAQLYTCRLSGLAFYRRLSQRHNKLLLAITAGTVFITAAFLPQIFLIVFHCSPVTALWPYTWQPEFERYTCMQWGIVYATNSAISVGGDLVVFAIPIAIIAVLKADRKKKMKLSAILLPGVVTIAISITRLYLVYRGGWVNLDGSWYYNPQLAIQNAEMACTMIALSIPGLKPLFGSLFSHIRAPSSGKSTNPLSKPPTGGASGVYGLSTIGKGGVTSANVSVGPRRGDGWERAESETDVEMYAEAVKERRSGEVYGAGMGGGDARRGLGGLGGIVVGRDFKVEVNRSDDSLLELKTGR